MSGERWKRHGIAAAAASVVIAYAVAMAHFAVGHGHFLADDCVSLWTLRRSGFWRYLITPFDVHVVPMHRLLTWGVDALFGFNYTAAVVVLASIHLAGVASLYRLLQRIRSSRANTVWAALYGVYVFMGLQLLWWSAGAARLSYLLFLLLAMHAYLHYRERGGLRYILAIAACCLVALGFFSKAMLLPVCLFGLELCLEEPKKNAVQAWSGPSRASRFCLLAGVCALVVGYMLVWRAFVNLPLTGLNFDLRLHAELQYFGFALLALSLVGQVLWSLDGVFAGWALAVVIALALVRHNRAGVRPVAVAAALVGANIFLVALSNRVLNWGLLTAFHYRYYQEPALLCILFFAIAFHHMRDRMAEEIAPTQWRRWSKAAVVAALTLVAVLASFNRATFARLAQGKYRHIIEQHAFMTNLQADLAWMYEHVEDELTMLDGHLPAGISPLSVFDHGLHSQLLEVMDAPVRFSMFGRYRIDRRGHVVPVKDAPAPP